MGSIRSGLVFLLCALLVVTMIPAAAASEHEAKPAVVRDAVWHLRDSLSGGPATTSFRYGRDDGFDGEYMMCDWNGDGTRTPSLRRRREDANPVWHVRNSNSTGPADHSFVYGRETDQVVCGDWNGDGSQTPGVVRRRDDGRLEWHLRNALAGGAADVTFVYGLVPDEPFFVLAGDWNGNGQDTPGIVRPRETDQRPEWHLRNALAGGQADIFFVYGSPMVLDPEAALTAIVGDWNGDGIDHPGIVRPTEANRHRWLLRDAHAGGHADRAFTYGRMDLLDQPLVWQ